jgi:hypothetical protein
MIQNPEHTIWDLDRTEWTSAWAPILDPLATTMVPDQSRSIRTDQGGSKKRPVARWQCCLGFPNEINRVKGWGALFIRQRFLLMISEKLFLGIKGGGYDEFSP